MRGKEKWKWSKHGKHGRTNIISKAGGGGGAEDSESESGSGIDRYAHTYHQQQQREEEGRGHQEVHAYHRRQHSEKKSRHNKSGDRDRDRDADAIVVRKHTQLERDSEGGSREYQTQQVASTSKGMKRNKRDDGGRKEESEFKGKLKKSKWLGKEPSGGSDDVRVMRSVENAPSPFGSREEVTEKGGRGGGGGGGGGSGKSDEGGEEEEEEEEQWIAPNLRVRVVDRGYRKGQFYNTKVIQVLCLCVYIHVRMCVYACM